MSSPSEPSTTPHLDALATVVADVIAPAAADVDRTGTYPRAALDALAAAGLLGLVSAEDVGGKRLVKLGFPPERAAALSALHTRNFM